MGSIPDPFKFNIAAQNAWLHAGYETLRELLLIPLAFILGQVINDAEKFRQRASVSLRIIFILYLITTILVLWFTPQLVTAMQQQTDLLNATIDYIRLESIAILLSSLYAFLSLVLVLKNAQKALYRLLIAQMVMTVLCDSILVSQLSYSFQLGVNGVAISNIVVNIVLAIFSVTYLSNIGVRLNIKHNKIGQLQWLKEGSAIG